MPSSHDIVFVLGRQRRQSRRRLIVRDNLFLASACADTSIGRANGYIELQSIRRRWSRTRYKYVHLCLPREHHHASSTQAFNFGYFPSSTLHTLYRAGINPSIQNEVHRHSPRRPLCRPSHGQCVDLLNPRWSVGQRGQPRLHRGCRECWPDH